MAPFCNLFMERPSYSLHITCLRSEYKCHCCNCWIAWELHETRKISAQCWHSVLTYLLTCSAVLTLTFDLVNWKIPHQLCYSCTGNVHSNFASSVSFSFRVRSRYGTHGWMDGWARPILQPSYSGWTIICDTMCLEWDVMRLGTE